jgi:hypothetical protein
VVASKLICDICGEEIREGGNRGYTLTVSEVWHQGEVIAVDICLKCGAFKLATLKSWFSSAMKQVREKGAPR